MKSAFSLVFALLLSSVAVYAQLPTFTGGHIQTLAVCKNSAANPINALLSVSDTSTGHTVSWTMNVPHHGALTGSYTTTSTGAIITPTGFSYMPNPGYSGSDTFTISFTDGSAIDTTRIIVSVDTVLNPGTISGVATVCVGAHVTYVEDTAGGVWSVNNSHATIDPSGMVTGVSAGRDTIVYTLTNGCGPTSATMEITVNTVPDAGHLATPDSICVAGHIALHTGGDPGGIWHSTNTVSATVNDTGRVTGIAPGTCRIAYIVTNGCGTDTATAEVKVQTHVLPIIGETTVCQFQTLILIDPSTGGNWSSSNFLVAPVLMGVVVGLTPGSATITYSLHNACGTTTASLNVTVITGGPCDTTAAVHTTAAVKDELNIYPNPNNGDFNLNLLSGTNEKVTVMVTNVVGEVVKEIETVTNQPTEVKLDKPSGIYFIKALTAGGKSYMARVVATQ